MHHPPIDYQDMHYWAAPKPKGPAPQSLDEIDPEIRADVRQARHLARRAGAALRVSRSTRSSTRSRWPPPSRRALAEVGRDLLLVLRRGARAPRPGPRATSARSSAYRDNFFAALNSAVFSDGSFCFVPAGVRCPMELSTYFRINAAQTGQFERTLIVAEEGASVSYLEGCTAPMRDENQLHAAVVELVALDDASIKYSTVQNWYPGDAEGKGGIYNFVTKRGRCAGRAVEDLLDPGRDRLGDHLEVPERDPAGRRLGRRVLLGRGHDQPPAGRHRHEDDPHRPQHDAARSCPRASPPATPRTPTAAWSRCCAPPPAPATTPSATRC